MRAIYCTVIDANFLSRAIALHASIARCSPTAYFAFFCLDKQTSEILEQLNLARTFVFPTEVCETKELAAVKATRKTNEYCWTLKPFAIDYARGLSGGFDWAAWLDADMWVFGDIDGVIGSYSEAACLLTPHRFSSDYMHFEPTVGRYNAGFVAFRNSADGVKALHWWAARCLESCPAVPTDSAFGDQKYLDQLATDFTCVTSVASRGFNAAPWNISDSKIEKRNGEVFLESDALTLYHFQSFKMLGHRVCDYYADARRLDKRTRTFIYRPYAQELNRQVDMLRAVWGDRIPTADPSFQGKNWLRLLLRQLRVSRNLAFLV